ncbi:hypothetical protein GCM10023145_38680 [Angustibacter luteus]
MRIIQRSFSIVMCAGLIAWGVSLLAAELAVSRDGVTAQAQVVSVEARDRWPDTFTVRFTTSSGRDVTTTLEDESLHTGDTVTIRYAASNPTQAHLAGSPTQILAGLLLIVLGLVFAYAAIDPARAFARPRKRP